MPSGIRAKWPLRRARTRTRGHSIICLIAHNSPKERRRRKAKDENNDEPGVFASADADASAKTLSCGVSSVLLARGEGQIIKSCPRASPPARAKIVVYPSFSSVGWFARRARGRKMSLSPGGELGRSRITLLGGQRRSYFPRLPFDDANSITSSFERGKECVRVWLVSAATAPSGWRWGSTFARPAMIDSNPRDIP